MRARFLMLVLAFAVTLPACGYKTPLSLPKPKPDATAPKPAPTPAPASTTDTVKPETK
jgi:predicted small lipoprotein YifL